MAGFHSSVVAFQGLDEAKGPLRTLRKRFNRKMNCAEARKMAE